MKHKRINKTGVTLLLILLITSLVAVASFSVAIVNSVKVHNLEKQVVVLEEELAEAQKQIVERESASKTVSNGEPEIKNLGTASGIYTYIGELDVTGYDAYCEHCCGKSDGITASMTQATVGRTVAMNRTDMAKLGIEYGTEIEIDGLGSFIVEDTGCGEGVIDVVCASHEDCYKITGTYNVFVKESV